MHGFKHPLFARLFLLPALLIALAVGVATATQPAPVARAAGNWIAASYSISNGDLTGTCTGETTYGAGSNPHVYWEVHDDTSGSVILGYGASNVSGGFTRNTSKFATVSGHYYHVWCALNILVGSSPPILVNLDSDEDFYTAP